MTTLLIILLIIVLILIVPFKFRIHFFYNVQKNRGLILISLFNIKLLFYKLKLNGLSIVAKNKNEAREIKLDLKTQNIDYINIIQKELIRRVYLNLLDIYSLFGISEDAFTTAIIGGGINALLANMKIFILSKKCESECSAKGLVCYDKDKFCFSIKIEFFITIFDVIFSLIIAQIKTISKRRIKKDGKQLSSH